MGAGSGALAGAMSDIGVNDKFMKELGETLPEGGAAVFILTRKVTGDKVLANLEEFRGKGRVLQTSLPDAEEQKLREAFDGGKLGAALGVPQADPGTATGA